MAITLLEIRTQARQRADMENSKFVSDSELNSYVNNSIAELHDLLCEANGSDYYVTSVETALADGSTTMDLPEDFYILKGVDIKILNDEYITIKRFNFNERNRYNELGAWDLAGVSNVRYRIVGDKVHFSPEPDRNTTVRLWYVPVATKLVADADELKDLNAFSEYVIVDAAIKMMQKEESDVSVLYAQKQALEKRIRDSAQSRDSGSPQSIQDIYAEGVHVYSRDGS